MLPVLDAVTPKIEEFSLFTQLSQNERAVLDLIWRRGAVARAELAELTGFSTGALTRITQELADRGLITESIRRDGTRGNPMRPLSIAADGAYAFGVSFSHRHMEVGLIDLQGRLVCSAREPLEEARPEKIAEVARLSVARLGEESGVDPARVAGIGFAVPGDFTTYPFVLAHAFFPHLRNVDLNAVFSADMPYPAFIENDCNSAALGERIMGFGQTYSTFISVFVCHGIGGGIIIDGNLYRGKNGNAGGLHAFYPLSQPRPSGHDLFDTMAREGVQIRDFFDFEVPEALDLPGVRPWIFRAGTQLRDSLTVVSRLFDPEAIIIGGRLPPPFLAEIAAVIDTKAFCAEAEIPRPKVHASELGPNAGIIGAAAVVLYARFLNANARNPRDNLINGRRIG